ncbi:hypothetical protein RND81_11G188900 [Saponaria officinalis]|uniref:Uncharacterized protein n=1 Tax=Saponaria officinalis TaxID=3572 RepID=A0AAW1HP10_SAPOF
MADELDDGEFWLPSDFLTDDDIRSNCPVHSKVVPLSTSPQSTLFGCDCNPQGSGSGSDSTHSSPTNDDDNEDKDDNNKINKAATLELLKKAAGEVAKMKLRSEKSTCTGTGFFDCSRQPAKKPLSSPPPPKPSAFPPSVYFNPHLPRFHPHMMWGPVQLTPSQQQQQSRDTKTHHHNNHRNNSNNKRPLGLAPGAWPPLPGQAQVQPMTSTCVGAPRESVGTGVFLPRRVPTPDDRKKSGNPTDQISEKSRVMFSFFQVNFDLNK